ncbi:hypothetical protein CEXT_53701 [Caerostris extrusa]|uniref:Uncharacterized protein n=1 Tax=Caerostris extrusa TaxID=172846 RepID=A0AAV4XBD8_CAEEX|nr:hypothetical protein CEXT_53701 [Caerostris extrusa]
MGQLPAAKSDSSLWVVWTFVSPFEIKFHWARSKQIGHLHAVRKTILSSRGAFCPLATKARRFTHSRRVAFRVIQMMWTDISSCTFLIGSSLVALPEPNFSGTPMDIDW